METGKNEKGSAFKKYFIHKIDHCNALVLPHIFLYYLLNFFNLNSMKRKQFFVFHYKYKGLLVSHKKN